MCNTLYYIFRSCQGIFYIPEFIQDNAGSQAPGDIQQKLKIAANTLNEHYDKYQRAKRCLLMRKGGCLKIIQKLRKEINNILDKLEQNTVAEIEVKYTAMIDKIDEELRLVQATKACVTSAQYSLTSAGSNVSQAFVSIRKGKIVASNVAKCIDGSKDENKTEDIDFKPDQKLLEILEEMTTLGNATLTNMMKVEHRDTSKARQPDDLVQITGKREHCVKVKSDQSVCDIVSACALEDGTIILSDRYSNNKVKRLDSSTYMVTDSCETPGNPWQVCGINNQQIAVSMQGMKDIHFISLEGKMTITNQMKTDHNCYGLAYANDNLYISDEHTIYIYSLSGMKLKQFTLDQSGQRLFSEISSLAVSEDGCHIYVADYHNGLIVLDNNGQVLGQYNGSELKGAHDIYLTVNGGVLVSGRVSNNVLQFGHYGELVGEVLKSDGGDRGCRAVCCDQNMSKMIVGRCKCKIEVFDLT